jgi:hypothetical protein
MKEKEKTKYPLPIREWSEDDRPREKLLKYGEQTLSNAELLAILIRTGTPGRSAVDIGRELLHKSKIRWSIFFSPIGRINRNKAGRLLDGRTLDDMPVLTHKPSDSHCEKM